VAKGYDQQRGVDYTETFSPVIKPATVRVLFALVVQFQWPIQQLDIFMDIFKKRYLWTNPRALFILIFRIMFVS